MKKWFLAVLALVLAVALLLPACTATDSSTSGWDPDAESGESNTSAVNYDDTILWFADEKGISNYYALPITSEFRVFGTKLLLYKESGELRCVYCIDIGDRPSHYMYESDDPNFSSLNVSKHEGYDNVYELDGKSEVCLGSGDGNQSYGYVVFDKAGTVKRLIVDHYSVACDYEYDENGNVSTVLYYDLGNFDGETYSDFDERYLDLSCRMPELEFRYDYYYENNRLIRTEDRRVGEYDDGRYYEKVYTYDENDKLLSIDVYNHSGDSDSDEVEWEEGLIITGRDGSGRISEYSYKIDEGTESPAKYTVKYLEGGITEIE